MDNKYLGKALKLAREKWKEKVSRKAEAKSHLKALEDAVINAKANLQATSIDEQIAINEVDEISKLIEKLK